MSSPRKNPNQAMYLPVAQRYPQSLRIVVGTTGDGDWFEELKAKVPVKR